MDVTEKKVVTKFVIDALRSRPHTEDEMREILTEKLLGSEGARRRKRSRYMQDLMFAGIVKFSHGKYRLRLSFENRTEVSKDIRVKHSRILIPALKQIARIHTPRYSMKEEEYISEQDMRLLIDGAMDHLSYYPDVWGLIVERIELEEKAERVEGELRLNLKEKLKNEFIDDPIVELGKERKRRIFIRTNIPALICSHLLYADPAQVTLEGEEIWFGSLIAKGPHLFNGVREFVRREAEDPCNIEAAKGIEEARKSATAIDPEIKHEIRKLILRIESDVPLRGGCEICETIGRFP